MSGFEINKISAKLSVNYSALCVKKPGKVIGIESLVSIVHKTNC
jgi:hypothetical protein